MPKNNWRKFSTCREYFPADHVSKTAYYFSRTCPNTNEFPCDADKCIPDSKMCDGINDCIDATDEQACALNHPQVLGLEVMGDNVNSTSVQVDWYLPDLAYHYEVTYQPGFAPEGTEDWTFLPWQSLPDRSYTFTNLRPFTTYKLVVNLKTKVRIVL